MHRVAPPRLGPRWRGFSAHSTRIGRRRAATDLAAARPDTTGSPISATVAISGGVGTPTVTNEVQPTTMEGPALTPVDHRLVPPRISLRRLNRLAMLPPEPTLVIAADALGELARLHAAGRALDGFDERDVWVDAQGRVTLGTGLARPPRPTTPEALEADRACARRLLTHLGQVTSDSSAVSQRLAAAVELDDDVAALAATLTPCRAGARAELADMVSALVATAPGRGGPAPRSQTRPTPGFGVSSGESLRRLGRWGLVLLALLALLALELAVFGGRISSDLKSLRAAGRPGSAAASTVTPAAPVTPPAPPANGAVTGVDLRALARCAPGSMCQTRLAVRLRPQATPRQVEWVFAVTDRCTGATQLVPGGSIVVGAGGGQLAAVSGVRLPTGRALGVTAVVTVPDRAASTALLMPADAAC